MATVRLFSLLLPKEHRQQLKDLRRQHRRITTTVDSFYELLGERNWVFTGDLNLAAMEHVIGADDALTAERRLIEYYRSADRIAFPLCRLHRFAEMRPRIGLLEKALVDYEAGRFYSAVLVLLSVMDGFVNEIETATRRGLHARPPADMVAWDSVVGHHLGLGYAHRSFVKTFRKTDTRRIEEVFRHGIIHGMLVNFDNEVVATKAWNRLFAVADWADARKRQAEPAEPTATLRESLGQLKEVLTQSVKIDQWQPYEYELNMPDATPSQVATACMDFLTRWQKQQWGPVGAHFMEFGDTQSPVGKLAVEAKSLYRELVLSEWSIARVRHIAAADVRVDVELVVNANTYRTELRWVRVDESSSPAMEWEPGRWVLSMYGPSHFLTPESVVSP